MAPPRHRAHRLAGLTIVTALAAGCAGDDTSGLPGVSVTGVTSSGTADDASTSTGAGDAAGTASSSGASSSDTAASTGGSSSTGSAADSTTGDMPLSLDETASQLRCVDDQSSVRILLLPFQFDGICPAPATPPPGVAVITIRGWDGMAGEFDVSSDGSSGTQAGLGTALQPATGTLALEVSAPWTPSFITYDLASASMMAAGSAELGLCRGDVAADPCA